MKAPPPNRSAETAMPPMDDAAVENTLRKIAKDTIALDNATAWKQIVSVLRIAWKGQSLRDARDRTWQLRRALRSQKT